MFLDPMFEESFELETFSPQFLNWQDFGVWITFYNILEAVIFFTLLCEFCHHDFKLVIGIIVKFGLMRL